MLISQTDDLVISAQHTELPDSFIIEIESTKVEHLINEFNNDFASMASHLKIMNKRMVLLNPVSILNFPHLIIFFRNSSQRNKMKTHRLRQQKKKQRSGSAKRLTRK